MSMNILVIGGSRNIGYYSALRFLEAGHTVTFLLRSLTAFDSDESVQKFIKSKSAHLVQGDALVKDDVQRAWTSAAANSQSGIVDLLLFSVGRSLLKTFPYTMLTSAKGAGPSQGKFHLTKGIIMTPPDLVTHALLNVLSTLPSTQTKIITISSTGITRTSKAALPIPIKLLYSYLIAAPHRDKCGAERVVSHVAGWNWDSKEYGEVGEDILDDAGKWKDGLPASGSIQDILVIRPGFLTDGESLADKKKKASGAPYRVSTDDFTAWTVSRKDVSHFVFDAASHRWDELRGKIVNIGY
ncbi:hypothetical protein H0H92_005331 [Tricholoma furcatifolium]|nr:hypothetical protein H0H92_005331 [Tricholoma furcatifolium]